MIEDFAPDLENGFIVNGLDDENSWMTEIQSVLIETRDGVSTYRYLAQECRSEFLPFAEGYLGQRRAIFMRDKPVEFLTYTEGENFYQLVSFDSVNPTATLGDYAKAESGHCFLLREVIGPEWKSAVCCPSRAVTVFSFQNALSQLQERRVPIRNLFLRVDWTDGGSDWSLHCPSRYINFSTRGIAKNDYIQPISGMVLMPGPWGGMVSGYVACASNGEGRPIIELLTRRYGDVFALLAERSRQPELEPVLEKFSSLISLSSPIYDLTVPVEGKFQLYTYAEPENGLSP